MLSELRRIGSINLSAAFLGFCLISLIVWLPTHFVEVGGLDTGRAATLSGLAPVAGIIGTLSIGWFFGRFLLSRETQGLVVLLLLLASLFLLLPCWPPPFSSRRLRGCAGGECLVADSRYDSQ